MPNFPTFLASSILVLVHLFIRMYPCYLVSRDVCTDFFSDLNAAANSTANIFITFKWQRRPEGKISLVISLQMIVWNKSSCNFSTKKKIFQEANLSQKNKNC